MTRETQSLKYFRIQITPNLRLHWLRRVSLPLGLWRCVNEMRGTQNGIPYPSLFSRKSRGSGRESAGRARKPPISKQFPISCKVPALYRALLFTSSLLGGGKGALMAGGENWEPNNSLRRGHVKARLWGFKTSLHYKVADVHRAHIPRWLFTYFDSSRLKSLK